MTRALLIALALWAAPALAQDQIPGPPQESSIQLGPSECGLVSHYASHLIGDGCYQVANNIVFDDDLGIQRRRGYAAFNAVALSSPAAIRRVYQYDAPDGNHYIVAVSSDKLWYATNAGNFTALTGVVSGSENTSCTQVLGKFWCVNKVNGLFYWDGVLTSTTAASAGPLGGLISNFRNRVLIADVASNQSRLYASGFLDGTDWTTASQSTSPFIQPITGVNDGEKITCLMGTYQDAFVIGTPNRLFGLYGFDNNDFQVRELSREVGCIENTSVQEFDGSLVWLSRRGIERLRGTSIDWRVSDPIFDILQTIVASAGNTVTLSDTSQSDFTAGNLSASGPGAPMSATISINNVVPSTWGVTEASTTSWAAGTFLNVSTISADGAAVYFMQSDTAAFINAGAESSSASMNWSLLDNNVSSPTAWNPVASFGGLSPKYGSRFFLDAMNFDGFNAWGSTMVCKVDILDPDGDIPVLSTACNIGTYVAAAVDWKQTYVNTSTITLSMIKIRIQWDSYDGILDRYKLATSSAFVRGLSVSVWTGLAYSAVNAAHYAGFDIDEDQQITSGTYTTQRYDTGLSTPIWGPAEFSVSSTPIQSPLTLQTRVATTSGGTLDVPVNVSTGHPVGSLAKQYIVMIASFSVASTTSTPSSLSSLSLSAATTGYFVSQCRNPGTTITSWGLFQCNQTLPTNVSMSLWVATGANCGAAISPSTAPWTSQPNNAVISVATAPYVAYRALFTFTSATQAINGVTLQDCAFTWNEGAARPESASAVIDHKYHLFYTTRTATGAVNSNALILDYYDRWSTWDDIPARTAATFQNPHVVVIGDGASNGKLYRLYSGYDDAGGAFTSRFRTKDFDAGDWKRRKEFIGVKLELSPLRDPADLVTLTVTGHVDKSTTTFALNTVSLGEDTGLVYGNIPTPLDSQTSGRYIGFDVSNTGSKHWRFYRGALQYRPLRED